MPKHIIGLVGLAGCGKGAVAEMLKTTYDADVFRFSTILSDILKRLAIEKSRDNLITASVALRKAFGEDALSYAIECDAFASKKNLVVIDGVRRVEDIAALEPLDIFQLIHISVPTEIRYERMKKRGEKVGESTMTYAQFLSEEKAPTEMTIPEVAARASKTIDNAGSTESLHKHITEYMAELGIAPL